MPAEWEPHAASWLAWPHNEKDWPGKFEPIAWVFAEIIRHLAKHERVELIVSDAAEERRAKKILDRADAFSANVRFHRWPTDRIWLRDSGCIFVEQRQLRRTKFPLLVKTARSGAPHSGLPHSGLPHSDSPRSESSLRALKFRFNAWAKYSNWRRDNEIGVNMAVAADTEFWAPYHKGTPIVLEGGSIDVNGCGTLLTTEECLVSKVQQRNPGMTRRNYENAFRNYLGITNVIWLGSGIYGDDTHGHVDDLTRFVNPTTVVTMVESDRRDVNHEPLAKNLERLKSARDQDGKPLNIIEIPMPQPVVFEGRRLPASYANFYIGNGVVLVPVFNRGNDRVALNTLAQVFPSREIIPIYSGDFIWGFGAMHCMTQQQPATT